MIRIGKKKGLKVKYMKLFMISETLKDIENLSHAFTDQEKVFIVQFAFKTSDKELTGKLMKELVAARDDGDRISIIDKFSTMYDVEPKWVNQIENLLVSIEMYRLEEKKAIDRLTEVLGAYSADILEEDKEILEEKKKEEKQNLENQGSEKTEDVEFSVDKVVYGAKVL